MLINNNQFLVDLKKFLPLVDTRVLLKKYSISNKSLSNVEMSGRRSHSADADMSNRRSNSSTSLPQFEKRRTGKRGGKSASLTSSNSKTSLRPTSFSDFRPR